MGVEGLLEILDLGAANFVEAVPGSGARDESPLLGELVGKVGEEVDYSLLIN